MHVLERFWYCWHGTDLGNNVVIITEYEFIMQHETTFVGQAAQVVPTHQTREKTKKKIKPTPKEVKGTLVSIQLLVLQQNLQRSCQDEENLIIFWWQIMGSCKHVFRESLNKLIFRWTPKKSKIKVLMWQNLVQSIQGNLS